MTEISHRTVETNGIKVHIAEAGSGPMVLFIHGWPESWYSWRHQLPAVAGGGVSRRRAGRAWVRAERQAGGRSRRTG